MWSFVGWVVGLWIVIELIAIALSLVGRIIESVVDAHDERLRRLRSQHRAS